MHDHDGLAERSLDLLRLGQLVHADNIPRASLPQHLMHSCQKDLDIILLRRHVARHGRSIGTGRAADPPVQVISESARSLVPLSLLELLLLELLLDLLGARLWHLLIGEHVGLSFLLLLLRHGKVDSSQVSHQVVHWRCRSRWLLESIRRTKDVVRCMHITIEL